MSLNLENIQQIVEAIPLHYPGPGGAIAVLKDGEVINEHVWGYADLDQRIPMSTSTLMPICSISKQMICMLLIELKHNPTPEIAQHGSFEEQMVKALHSLLPEELTRTSPVQMDHLCDNQSGIRDYWATSMLCGAKAEGRFTLEHEAKIMRDTITSLHFEPGTEFSYCNMNFHLLGRALEIVSKVSIESLLNERIFGPAKMKTARFLPDTTQQPPPCIGYEGNEQTGYIPGKNFIVWSGDAGVVASLADMIAYEQYFDKIWTDSQNTVRVVGESRSYRDGKSARYRYGLDHVDINDVDTVGHGGALRGYRLHRRYAKEERLSVVVMFNHEADAEGACKTIIRQALNLRYPDPPKIEPSNDWFGDFLDNSTQLLVRVKGGEGSRILVNYSWEVDTLRLVDRNHAESEDMKATISGSSFHMERDFDNHVIDAERLTKGQPLSPEGSYDCDALKSVFICEKHGSVFYGAFDGPLGHGPADVMDYIGGNVWTLQCHRSLDAPAPGPWTLVFHEDGDGGLKSVTIGTWLARHSRFENFTGAAPV